MDNRRVFSPGLRLRETAKPSNGLSANGDSVQIIQADFQSPSPCMSRQLLDVKELVVRGDGKASRA